MFTRTYTSSQHHLLIRGLLEMEFNHVKSKAKIRRKILKICEGYKHVPKPLKKIR